MSCEDISQTICDLKTRRAYLASEIASWVLGQGMDKPNRASEGINVDYQGKIDKNYMEMEKITKLIEALDNEEDGSTWLTSVGTG